MPITAWLRTMLLPSTLLSRWMLHLLFWINFLGTIYGYYWYWNQMVVTISEKPIWMVVFVPDSPTASLFFTITALWFLMDWSSGRLTADGLTIPFRRMDKPVWLRSVIEALAVITSFKYGIWAVTIIVAGTVKGSPVEWEDWMLSISHLGMAVEVLLFLGFYRITRSAFVIASLWTFTNDTVDYTFGVYPWLPETLMDSVPIVGVFTFCLTAFSIALCTGLYRFYRTAGRAAA